MNKKDYAELHRLLAILKYELVKAIDILMKVFIVECDNK